MMENKISIILMILGIGSLIGSKLGGILADRIGITRTIFSAMLLQVITLVLVSLGSGFTMVTIVMLMIWEMACWTFGPTQNFNLVSLAPEVSVIVLSLNSTFVQLGFALGAGIGGIVVEGWSIMAITWISAVSTALAILTFNFARYFIRADGEVIMEEQCGQKEYKIS